LVDKHVGWRCKVGDFIPIWVSLAVGQRLAMGKVGRHTHIEASPSWSCESR
jgi:hypothetical protein